MKVKTILVSQPEPKVENSPYLQIVEKQKVKIVSDLLFMWKELMQRM